MVSPDSQHESGVAHVVGAVCIKSSVMQSDIISGTLLHLGVITQQYVDYHPRVAVSCRVVESRLASLQ